MTKDEDRLGRLEQLVEKHEAVLFGKNGDVEDSVCHQMLVIRRIIKWGVGALSGVLLFILGLLAERVLNR